MVSIQFTVFFEDPYWVGLIEERSNDSIGVGRTVFGAEPSNAQIVDFVLHKLSYVRLHETSDRATVVRQASKPKPEKSTTRRSLDIYKAALSAVSSERKSESRLAAIRRKEEAYRRKQEKRRRKKRGH